VRALGLDLGERRIGVAVSDPDGMLAMPMTAIDAVPDDQALERIAELAREHDVEMIVVGLPVSLDGSLGPQAQLVKSWADAIAGHTQILVVTWDERLSTVAAGRALADAGVKRGKRKKRLDSVAASLVLQAYLDRQRSGGNSHP
jgi:putative Holliday junction resolvase